MPRIPARIIASTAGVCVGVVLTWSQADALATLAPAPAAEVGMGLVAVCTLLGIARSGRGAADTE